MQPRGMSNNIHMTVSAVKSILDTISHLCPVKGCSTAAPAKYNVGGVAHSALPDFGLPMHSQLLRPFVASSALPEVMPAAAAVKNK